MELDLSILKELSPFEFKNILHFEAGKAHKKHLLAGGEKPYLNTGRGNPNFLNTHIRNAFAYLELFVSHLSHTYLPEYHTLGLRPIKKGIAKKLDDFIQSKGKLEETVFLRKAIEFAIHFFSFDPDEFVFELCDAAIGDYYPDPPRILPRTEQIVKAYLDQIIAVPLHFQKKHIDLFATEGASAAMIYLFNSLKINKILKDNDTIAVWTPIFAPYLELPLLDSYKLKTIFLESRSDLDWQMPDSELEKLKDPRIKALFVVNPTNPTSVSIDKTTIKKIGDIVRRFNKELIVITDTVYCTFVDDYYSFFQELPENTVFIYSFSKYFGVTGWRLGIIMLQENNLIDRLIANLPEKDQKILHNRYKIVTADPPTLKFIDRLEADSREESLAHTGGLACPQQALMCLFCLFHLMDEKLTYKAMVRDILTRRAKSLFGNLEIPFEIKPNNSYFYVVLDMADLALKKYGKDFGRYFANEVNILEFLIRLAKQMYTICLPGYGFHGPASSIRISLSNMDESAYALVGQNIKNLLHAYYEEWKKDQR
jgi:aspartate 4-decarboxylase